MVDWIESGMNAMTGFDGVIATKIIKSPMVVVMMSTSPGVMPWRDRILDPMHCPTLGR